MRVSRYARLRVLIAGCLLAVGVNTSFETNAIAGPYDAAGIAGWVDVPGGGSVLNPELRTWASEKAPSKSIRGVPGLSSGLVPRGTVIIFLSSR